jgi:hypothetical protein
MYAHSLWINLWTDLGVAEENSGRPERNEVIEFWRPLVSHSPRRARQQPSHTCCARPTEPLPGQTKVIHPMHRSYDDYQSY